MSRYELCSTCRKAAKHVVPTYWNGMLLCPWCCRQTAEKFDLVGWPRVPWKED